MVIALLAVVVVALVVWYERKVRHLEDNLGRLLGAAQALNDALIDGDESVEIAHRCLQAEIARLVGVDF